MIQLEALVKPPENSVNSSNASHVFRRAEEVVRCVCVCACP